MAAPVRSFAIFTFPPPPPADADSKMADATGLSTATSALSSQIPADPKEPSDVTVISAESSVQAEAAPVIHPDIQRAKICDQLWTIAFVKRWRCDALLLGKVFETLANKLCQLGYANFLQLKLSNNPTELFVFTATKNGKPVKLKIAPRDLTMSLPWLNKYMSRDGSRGELCALAHLNDMNNELVFLNCAFCLNRQGNNFSIDKMPGDDCYLVAQEFDYVPGEELFAFLHKAKRDNPGDLRLIFSCATQVVNIVKKQHDRRCANRDIKSPNFIVDRKTGKVTGIDNDSMIYLPDSPLASSPRCTGIYCSLERLEAMRDEQSCDVFQADRWAVSVVLYELFVNASLIRRPSNSPLCEGLIASFNKRLPITLKNMDTYLRQKGIPEALVNPLAELLRELFDPDPQKRPTLEVVSERLTKLASQVES